MILLEFDKQADGVDCMRKTKDPIMKQVKYLAAFAVCVCVGWFALAEGGAQPKSKAVCSSAQVACTNSMSGCAKAKANCPKDCKSDCCKKSCAKSDDKKAEKNQGCAGAQN